MDYEGNVGYFEVVSKKEITLLQAYSRASGIGKVIAVSERVGVTRQTIAKAYTGTECSKPLSELIEEKTGLPAEAVCFLHKSKRWCMAINRKGYATVLSQDQWERLVDVATPIVAGKEAA